MPDGFRRLSACCCCLLALPPTVHHGEHKSRRTRPGEPTWTKRTNRKCSGPIKLAAGWRRGDLREVVGQVPRIAASIVFSRLWVPRGNSGRSRVSAFKPMPVPADLQHLVP
ncbi:MAG: DUF3703 domain-containing protein [Ideonella sp.]|nr:MAG: DUF3703 domain-containing protein [Burkholderiaceae bacterium]MBE7420772.1 DUF3703 domain-containing protein [Ideonella sp.]